MWRRQDLLFKKEKIPVKRQLLIIFTVPLFTTTVEFVCFFYGAPRNLSKAAHWLTNILHSAISFPSWKKWKKKTQLGRKCLFGGYFPHVLKFKNHQVFLSVYDETFRWLMFTLHRQSHHILYYLHRRCQSSQPFFFLFSIFFPFWVARKCHLFVCF